MIIHKENDWIRLFLIFSATIVAIIPSILIKKYTINKKSELLIYAILLYILLTILYVKIYQDYDLSNVYTIIQILQICIIAVAGIVIFNEHMDYNKIIGIFFSILSIYYLL
jgi:multidrug transporter EmrE-like cation transporter